MSLLVSSKRKIASEVTLFSVRESLIILTNAIFELIASEPPLKIQELPALKQSENASTDIKFKFKIAEIFQEKKTEFAKR